MKSYTQGRNQYGVWTKNTSTANLTQGDLIANDDYRHILAMKDWPFLKKPRTLLTTTSQFVNLPYDCDLVRSVTVTIDDTRYTPRQCPSREQWDMLNRSTFTSDIPEWWIVFNGQIGLWPTPATAGNTITINQKCRVIDLSVADYTTGTITSIANGALAVVGNSTVWTERMIGRFIRFTYSDTANTGDGEWYEIATVPSATTMTLVRAYGGTSIAGGTATYTIGQMPLLPEAFHDMPWLAAAADYWSKEKDERAAFYQGKYDALAKLLENTYSNENNDMVIDSGMQEEMINPNLTISL